MSFVTFVRDYIQDPDKIVHIPSFIFDACREFLWYIFSFQWLRNLTYVTLSLAYPEGLSSGSGTFFPMEKWSHFLPSVSFGGHVPFSPSATGGALSTMIGDFLASIGGSEGLSISIPNVSETVAELSHSQSSLPSLLTNSVTPLGYGFFNGITSNFHFCAVTIVIAHIILNENKNRAFKIAAISCLGDLSCMVAVLLGFRRLVIPWFGAEPLGYFLGFAIQFYFALEIIKDNRRIKSSSRTRTSEGGQVGGKQRGTPGDGVPLRGMGTKPVFSTQHQGGRLSYNYWLIPGLILFSWCDQTQFFQTLGSNGFQPTATLMGLPFVLPSVLKPEWQSGSNLSTAVTSLSPLLPSNAGGENWHLFTNSGRELQILVYLLTYIITRVVITWIGLSIFQKVIDWKNNNYFRPLNWIYSESKLMIQKVANFINLRFRGITKEYPFGDGAKKEYEGQFFGQSGTLAPPKKVQHLLRDPLAIAAVTCSFAFLPSYSTNLLVTKSVGFFPEENRIKHSFFSPWDMPAEVLASDMDFISSHHNLAEYPFFLPFYDKGDYGGWLGVGEEDVRYGPFRLWQTRRIRAPWRRTTLQEPALTYANDKSLFVNPNPNPRKEESTSITLGQPLGNSPYPKVFEENALPTQDNSLYQQKGIQKFSIKKDSGGTVTFVTPMPYVPPTLPPSGVQVNKGVQPKVTGRSPEAKGYEGKQSSERDTELRFPFTESDGQSNTTITKGGQKRLIEGFRKPVRKISTSKLFNLSSFPLPTISSSYPFPFIKGDGVPLLYPEGESTGTLKKHKEDKPGVDSSYLPKKYRIGGFVNTLSEIGENISKKFSNALPKALLPEVQIKNTKQIRKRFKKFKKRVRLFRSKSYKKRNTKIRRLKHFHYLRNKKKKRRKSRRLIYKLRRQFPYMRNIKERKAEIFGFYSPVSKSDATPFNLSLPYTEGGPLWEGDTKDDRSWIASGLPLETKGKKERKYEVNSNFSKNAFDYFATTGGGAAADNINNEKSFYDRGYPKNKIPSVQSKKGTESFLSLDKTQRNTKKDFNLIFRTQIGERLEFAQEEIRARIFMNPYIRFLLNKRIDNFLSREKRVFSNENYKETEFATHSKPPTSSTSTLPALSSTSLPAERGTTSPSVQDGAFLPVAEGESVSFVRTRTSEGDKVGGKQRIFEENKGDGFTPSGYQMQGKQSSERGDRFWKPKVRKYGQSAKLTVDAEEKLFKRRLIISKYADAIDFLKPNLRHSYVDRVYNHQFKGTLSTARRLFSLKVQFDQALVQPTNYEPVLEHEDQIQNIDQDTAFYPFSPSVSITKGSDLTYAQPKEVHVLTPSPSVMKSEAKTGRVSPKTTQSPEYKENEIKQGGSALLEKSSSAPFYAAWDSELRKLIFTNRYLDHKLATRGESKVEKNHHQQFTSWPLKESYFKDNEFLVSQLYSNSQPIDSFLSQENEKARSVTLPRRVNSFNTVLSYKNSVPPTDAQRSQQFFKIENNDRKTFLFKHLWTPSNTAKPMVSNNFINKNKYKIPTSAEQRKTTRMEEREYPLWMVLRTLAPNQGGFLWPGD